MEFANVLELSACRIWLCVDDLRVVPRAHFSRRTAGRRRNLLSHKDFGDRRGFSRRAAEKMSSGKKTCRRHDACPETQLSLSQLVNKIEGLRGGAAPLPSFRLPRRVDGGQEQGDKDADDGINHQQIHQAKGTFFMTSFSLINRRPPQIQVRATRMLGIRVATRRPETSVHLRMPRGVALPRAQKL
jgi:hypothetical protein